MSLFPIGIAVATVSFLFAARHLNQSIGSYYDLVALLVVLGGTIAVSLMLIPWNMGKEIFTSLAHLIKGSPVRTDRILLDCIESIKAGRSTLSEENKNHIFGHLMRDGFELIGLGFTHQQVQTILKDRLYTFGKRRRKIANAIRNLSKYPPAFGLMGTVLGLVNVMRGVSIGMDGKQTSLEMAVALVATMYGLVVANLFINPAGEIILKRTLEDEAHGDLAITALDMYQQGRSLLETQEALNSFAIDSDRVNILKTMDQSEAA